MVCPATGATRGVALAYWRLGLPRKGTPRGDRYPPGGVCLGGLLELRPAGRAVDTAPAPSLPTVSFRSRVGGEAVRGCVSMVGCAMLHDRWNDLTWFFEPFQTDLDELLSAQGLTDLECLYAVMLQIQERETRSKGAGRTLCGYLTKTALGRCPQHCDVMSPTLALWCFGEYGLPSLKTGAGNDRTDPSSVPIHQRLRKIEASHCSALTGRAREHHTLGPAIWPPTFSN
jgi:hypothetical protein